MIEVVMDSMKIYNMEISGVISNRITILLYILYISAELFIAKVVKKTFYQSVNFIHCWYMKIIFKYSVMGESIAK